MEANLQATEWDRDTLIKARWLVGCQEAKAGKVHKSLIRQVWIPDEWLADEEPENPPRHGKDSTKELRSSRQTGQVGAPVADKGSTSTPPVSAPQVVPKPPPAPTAKTAEGANGSNSGPKDPKARVKAGDENELHGTKHSDGSTGISSPFDTSSNSSKESSPVDTKDGCSGSSSRNVINISSCITSDRGKTISLDASITPKRNRVPTAEEEATAALSAMLGLGKPKAPQKPTPPPRTHVPWSSSSAESSYAPEKPRKGLNPNAAEFHPCMWSYDCEYEYDLAPPPPPPLEGDEAHEALPELPEMSNLLGVNLLDEICGGAAVPQAGQRMDDDEADA